MKDSVFTKIIKGEIPCHKVYEDEDTLAFMDIHPIQEGMVVIIPKRQIADFEDLPPELVTKVTLTAHKTMKALRALNPDVAKISLQVAGFQTPDHAHITVYPANSTEEYHAESPTEEPDHDKLAALAEKIRKEMKSQ